MDPVTLSLIFGAASTIPQWLSGMNQESRADELSSGLKRPTMAIPESQTKALGLATNLAEMDRLPGQSAIEGRLDQTTANQIAMIERMGIGGPTSINAASTAYGNQQNQESALGVKAAEFKVRNQMNLQNELEKNAQWEQEAWKWNEAQPYMDKAAAIQALREGGMRNKNAAWKNLFGMGANFFGGMGSGDNTPSWMSDLKWEWENPASVGMSSNTPIDPSAPSANITPKGPEQKRIYEMMWNT